MQGEKQIEGKGRPVKKLYYTMKVTETVEFNDKNKQRK